MKIKKLTEIEKEIWNRFILENKGSFLQSFEWGEFQRAFGPPTTPEHSEGGRGRRVFRLVGEDWRVQIIEMVVPILNKKYWYGPRGPIFSLRQAQAINYSLSEAERVEGFINQVKSEAKKEGVMFFRVGPEWPVAGRESLIANGFKPLHYDIEPSQTLILDLDKSEEELLAQMHEKWRYNIRLAERKGVVIKIISATDADFEKYFEEFYRLVNDGTSERKNIKHHPEGYYKKQLEIEGDLKMKLFIAEYENEVIAANIVAIFGQTATYLHGATSSEHREVMAPHLLQWEQIKFAKSLGCQKYDFWGIVNEHTLDKRGPSWAGFTRFKKGFSGREENYVGYFDYPVDKFWYSIYKLVQKIRR